MFNQDSLLKKDSDFSLFVSRKKTLMSKTSTTGILRGLKPMAPNQKDHYRPFQFNLIQVHIGMKWAVMAFFDRVS